MTKKLAVLMDPIESIKIHKDSTFAMLLEAQRRNWNINYIIPGSLYVADGIPYAQVSNLKVIDNEAGWFKLDSASEHCLSSYDVILMRKDPPFDMEYIYTTYILELAQNSGSQIINNPVALRNFNEKFSILNFPQCCTPTLVTGNEQKICDFTSKHKEVILKPLDTMGGQSVFKVMHTDNNKLSVISTITRDGHTTVMAQRFIPEISEGDKRILIVNGEPVPFALARIPREGEFLGNLAAGGMGKGKPLNERDYWICSELKEALVKNGIAFAGIDVIGPYLTEINITSPTCIRELDREFDLNISSTLFDYIETSQA
jgi:glutathione synthase